MVGYTGGDLEYPSYKLICTNETNHAEAVLLLYESNVVSFKELCKKLFSHMDPTQLNKQGLDEGTQYRSAIFYLDEQQKKEAQEAIKEEQPSWSDPIVTEIVPAGIFWRAEENHQPYLQKGG